MRDVEAYFVDITIEDKAAIVFDSLYLFFYYIFDRELTVSPDRKDLPKEWHNKQIMSEKQRIMVCDRSDWLAFRTSRKIAKSLILARNFYQWSILHAGKAPTDGLLHTPREHHLTKIRLLIENKIKREPFLKMLFSVINRSKGYMEAVTGITWYLRIEGKTGTGESMVGPAALYEIGDEQDYANWGAYNERQQAILPGAKRALGGVPRGVQHGPFWSIANLKAWGHGWSIFRGADGYNCFINPIYCSDEARRKLETDHGGTETQAYQTQVLGLDGAQVSSSFPFIPMVVQEFALIEGTGADVDSGAILSDFARIPQIPAEMAILVGDMGRAPAPTEMGYFRLFNGVWIETARMHLTIADSFQTSEAIHAFNLALPQRATVIVIDSQSQGTGIYDQLIKNEKWATYEYPKKVIETQFNNYTNDERKLVHSTCKHMVRSTQTGWYCDVCGIPIFRRDDLEPMRVQVKQWAFAMLKDCLATGQRWLTDDRQKMDYPPIVINREDEDLLYALEGTTEKETAAGNITWDSPSRHLLDMMMAAVIGINKLEAWGKADTGPSWLDEVGWSGGQGAGQLMPWEALAIGGRK